MCYILSRARTGRSRIGLLPRNAGAAHPKLWDMTGWELSFHPYHSQQLGAGYRSVPQLSDKRHVKRFELPILQWGGSLLKPLGMRSSTQEPQSSESTVKRSVERGEDPCLFTLSPCIFKTQWWEKVGSFFP